MSGATFCSKCGTQFDQDASFCVACGTPRPAPATPAAKQTGGSGGIADLFAPHPASVTRAPQQQTGTPWEELIQRRYRDLFTVANAIVTLGQRYKFFGKLVAVFTVIIAVLIVMRQGFDPSRVLELLFASTLSISVLFIGFSIASALYMLGIFVAAQGQILYAVADIAVNTSALPDEAKRQALLG